MQDSNHSKINNSTMKNSSIGMAGSTQASSELKSQTNKSAQSKIMITGDDILIEYVARLVKQLSQTSVDLIKPVQLNQIEKFVIHYVWKQPDQMETAESAASNQRQSQTHLLRMRLVNRLNEMIDRRRRLIKYNYKKEEKSHLFEAQYPETIRRKEQVIQKFSSL